MTWDTSVRYRTSSNGHHVQLRRTVWRLALPDNHARLLQQFITLPGILGYVLGADKPFRQAFATFLSGEARALLIAGEPGNGKSTLLDDIMLAHQEFGDFPLAGITYDAVHSAFLDALGIPLPRGETYPPARDLVSDVLRDVILHALERLPAETRVLVEAPLVDRRGEAALEQVVARGHRVVAVAVNNPHVWRHVLANGQRDSELAAQTEAMLAIRRRFARREGAEGEPLDKQEEAIAGSWNRWARTGDRLVLTWSGPGSDASVAVTNDRRSGNPLPWEGLFPEELARRTRELCVTTVESIPDLPAFIDAIRSYDTDQLATLDPGVEG
jgi:hypothetical protein